MLSCPSLSDLLTRPTWFAGSPFCPFPKESSDLMSTDGSVYVIVNPISGRGGDTQLQALCERLREAGHDVVVRETERAGHARELAAECCRAGASGVVVAGGDGTLNEVVSGMEGDGVPILIVASGTENIMAKYLGLTEFGGTSVSGRRLLDVFQGGREVAVDVPSVNGRPFTLIVGVGFDAEVVRLLSQGRAGHISYWHYFWPIWSTFWRYRHPRVVVEADGDRIFEGTGLVLVGNVPRYAVGLRILREADPGDGLLDVCVFRCFGRVRLLTHALWTLLRRHVGSRDVVYRQAKRVRISSDVDGVPVQVDGDVAGVLPADIGLTPTQVRFLVAADWRA